MKLCSRIAGLFIAKAVLIGVAFVPVTTLATPVDIKAPQVLLIDDRSGTILLSRNENVPIPPASLAKLMTAEIVFEALEKRETTLETPYPVSEYAWRTGGAPSGTSTMFARIKSSPTVADLLQGLIIQSANDAGIILAEGLAGSEAKFVDRMNRRAGELGLLRSKFVNSTGLPAEGQIVTLEDLIKLARHIRSAHPEYYNYYAQDAFTWNNIMQRNRNPLLRLDVGADGMGTGYTQDSGFALVGSAQQNGRRLFLAMSGLSSAKEREQEAKKLIDWGMTSFDDVRIFSANDIVGHVQVFGGVESVVPVTVKQDVELLLSKASYTQLKAYILYQGPIHAPVMEDVEIGVLQFILDGKVLQQVPVFSAQTVARGSLVQRAWSGMVELSTGWLRKYL